MVKAKRNQQTDMHFTVFSADGITPLTGQAGNCTYRLRYNGAVASEGVSIAEVPTNTGTYYARFTPVNIGVYDLEVTCPDDRVMGDSFEVEAADLDDLKTEIDVNEGKIDIIDGIVDDILEDTGTTLPATLSTMDGKLDAIQTIVNNLPDSGALTTLITHLTDIKGAGWTNENLTTIDSLIDLIKAVTDQLPDAGALTTLITHLTDIKGGGWTNENLATIDSLIDAIKLVIDQLPDNGALTTLINHLTDIKGAGWTNENLKVIDSLIDAVKLKTDNLPPDPADQSLVEAAITTAEGNIRGADSDDLKDISDQIDVLPIPPTLSQIINGLLDEVIDGTNHFTSNTVGETLTIIRGLVQQNFRVVPLTRNSRGKMLTGTLKVFNNKADTDNDTSEIATLSITATYLTAPNDHILDSYKVTRD